jgi:hypothetical protein
MQGDAGTEKSNVAEPQDKSFSHENLYRPHGNYKNGYPYDKVSLIQ